jgi:hypothetical protein
VLVSYVLIEFNLISAHLLTIVLPVFSSSFLLIWIQLHRLRTCRIWLHSIPLFLLAHSMQLPRCRHPHQSGQERISDAEKAAESAVNGTPKQKAQAQQEILGTGAK